MNSITEDNINNINIFILILIQQAVRAPGFYDLPMPMRIPEVRQYSLLKYLPCKHYMRKYLPTCTRIIVNDISVFVCCKSVSKILTLIFNHGIL